MTIPPARAVPIGIAIIVIGPVTVGIPTIAMARADIDAEPWAAPAVSMIIAS
jgi:hypothetical protein